jgi:hypothetical protein
MKNAIDLTTHVMPSATPTEAEIAYGELCPAMNSCGGYAPRSRTPIAQR